ncbi:MAG TPA: BatD family protein, partial [Desulfatiglandales bacterium]|nr:BatD family protein [Desulfatiglandales bacterium]
IFVPCRLNAEVSLSLNLNRDEATVMDSVTMVLNVSGAKDSDSKPVLHGVEDFIVTEGGTSSRIEIINGQINAGVEYTYFLQPNKTGAFKIGPAEVTVKGKTFKSNIETLTVVKPGKSEGADRGSLFLIAELSSKEVYVEEQVIYTLKFYRQSKVRDVSLSLPETEHFTLKQLGDPIEYQSTYNGQPYQVSEVRFLIASPKEGDYLIGSARVNLSIIQPGGRSPRSLLDDPFFRDPFFSLNIGHPMTLTGDPLEFSVLPLPEAGRPADFSGLVGDFNMESKLEPTTVKAGESATLTILVSGLGNVNRIPDLKLPELSKAKIYGDQPVLKVENDKKGVKGSKTMKWALVPEKEGLMQIPPLMLSFFDTKSHQYRRIMTSPHSLSVLPSEKEDLKVSEGGIKEGRAEGPSKQEIKELGHDILPVHTSLQGFTSPYPARPDGLNFWLIFLMPFLIYATAFAAIKFRKKSIQALPSIKSKKAAGIFIKECRRGKLNSRELILLTRDYLNNRFNMSLGALTPDEAFEILNSKGVSPDTTKKLHDILKRLDDTVYTGRGYEPCGAGKDIPKLIKQIEKEIR